MRYWIAAAAFLFGLAAAQAEEVGQGTPAHGFDLFGDLNYPADFKHFSYVNPDAPQGRNAADRCYRRAFYKP